MIVAKSIWGLILRRVTREMLESPYYYGSLIVLRGRLGAGAQNNPVLQ